MIFFFSNVPAVAQAYIAPALAPSGTVAAEGTVGSIDVCVRCGSQVFIAEKRQAAGNVSYSERNYLHYTAAWFTWAHQLVFGWLP